MKSKFIACFILMCFSTITIYAQTVKTPTAVKKPKPVQKKKTVQKKTSAKTVTTKSTVTKVGKRSVKVTTITTKRSVKIVPVKTPLNYNLSIAELNMSDREKQMVEEINLVRSSPRDYIKYVKEYLKKADASDLSKEIKDAAKELMDELKKLSALNTLTISPRLYIDAREFGKELLETNTIGHSNLPYAENLVFGIENIRNAIIELLIDADIEGRGHRVNILKKNITMVAAHEIRGKVEDFPYCFIQEFQ